MVNFESQDGAIWSFQMPCRFAGWVPGREDEMSRYRPNWNNRAENCGSFTCACCAIRTSVGWSAAAVRPRSTDTRWNSA